VFWKGLPTYASTQTIFTILKAKWYYLDQNKFVEWDVTARADVVVPGQHETAIAVPWGGTAHPVWFKSDPRVANCRVLGGVLARPVMEGVVQTTQMVKEKIKPLPPAEQEKLDQRLRPAWERLGKADGEAAWARGWEMALESAVEYSLQN